MLRVGLIVDSGTASEQVRDLVERSRSTGAYTVEILLVQEDMGSAKLGLLARIRHRVKTHGLGRALSLSSWKLLRRLDRTLVRREDLKRQLRPIPIEAVAVRRVAVRPALSPSGRVHRFDEKALAAIKAEKLDVLVRCGHGILRGGILDVCRFGVLSFHHGDNTVNRGGPPGFWEVHERQPTTGFVIQRLTEELDGGDVLMRGAIPTAPLWSLNESALYRKANTFMHRLLVQIAGAGALPPAEPRLPYARALYTAPNGPQQIDYLFKRFLPFVAGRIRRRIQKSRDWRWSVAYLRAGDWRDAVLWRARTIPNKPHRFLADPVLFTRGGDTTCFAEEYDYRTRRGTIVAYRFGEDGPEDLGTVLSEPFHLSFPFVFEHEGEVYMCPDTHEAREIRLYRAEQYPVKWRHCATLMRDVSAVDTMIFPNRGRWWMFTNIDSAAVGEHNSELHVYYAGRPDSSEWTPHRMNPVIFDAARGRNGGLIREGDDVYRVFQRQDFDCYGAAMGIAKVEQLDENSYRENIVCEIPPAFRPGISGTHSFTASGGFVAVDYLAHERVDR